MVSATLEILVIVGLVLVNGYLALAEIAVVSARRSKLRQLAQEGSTKAGKALEAAENPTNFLSTIQVGITLVGVLVGAFGGVTTAKRIATFYQQFTVLEPYSHALAVGTIVVLITYLMLIFGELVPKHIAFAYPERAAAAVITPMNALGKLAYPFVTVLSASTNAVLTVLGIEKRGGDRGVTEEEIKALVQQGRREGEIEQREQEMVESVFLLDDKAIAELMTPRPEVIWLDVNADQEEIEDKIIESQASHFPVANNSLDNVLGMVRANELLSKHLRGDTLDLEQLTHKPLYVPESMPASKVLDLFKNSGQHIAFVVDEYGNFDGLVTLDDILAEVVGDIPLTESQAVQREDGSWLVDGMLPVDEFKDLFNIDTLPDEDKDTYHTVSGFLMLHTEDIPETGEQITWNNFSFEIMDMDGHHIDKVLIQQQEEDGTAENTGENTE